MEASIGHMVSATKEEIATVTARTNPNSAKSRPASLGRKEIGTKTAISVIVVAITAKNT